MAEFIRKHLGKIVSAEPLNNAQDNEAWKWRKEYENFSGVICVYQSQHKKPGKHFIIIVNDRLRYLKTSAGELKYEGDLLTLVTDNSKYTFKIIDDKERKVNECQNADRPETALSEKEATDVGKHE